MQLSDSIFLFFFLPMVILGYYFFYFIFKEKIILRNIWLFLSSLFFYAWSNLGYTVLLLLSIAVNFLLGKYAERFSKQKKGKNIVAVACLYNIGVLFIFKYAGSIAAGVSSFFGVDMSNSMFVSLALPVGISFYTFKALSYVIDVYRGKEPAQNNLVYLGLYFSFFPSVISGPIVKYHSVAGQFEERNHSVSLFSDGVTRYVAGLAKTLLLGAQLYKLSNHAFSMVGGVQNRQ